MKVPKLPENWSSSLGRDTSLIRFFSGLHYIPCINRQMYMSLDLPFIDVFIKLFYNITVYKHNEFKLSLYLQTY